MKCVDAGQPIVRPRRSIAMVGLLVCLGQAANLLDDSVRAADKPHEVSITVAEPVAAVRRAGITGAGWAFVQNTGEGAFISLVYPNHPDDFGGSVGTGLARSADGGLTWTQGPDDWPFGKMIDSWIDRRSNGELVAMGIRWTPDTASRQDEIPAKPPADAYALGTSSDEGKTWKSQDAVIDCPVELGVIARPMPHLFENKAGAWFMPAYSWSKSGNRSLLLRSDDRGRHWQVYATIATVTSMREAGTPPTTPWLETAVVRTADGSLLAVIRTGSSEQAPLLMTRSTDDGRTWSPVKKLLAGVEQRVATGKLPNLLMMPNGELALLTAHTKFGCVLYVSPDGAGRRWSDAHVITPSSGSNTSMVAIKADELQVFTPANGRITSWRVAIKPNSTKSFGIGVPGKE